MINKTGFTVLEKVIVKWGRLKTDDHKKAVVQVLGEHSRGTADRLSPGPGAELGMAS